MSAFPDVNGSCATAPDATTRRSSAPDAAFIKESLFLPHIFRSRSSHDAQQRLAGEPRTRMGGSKSKAAPTAAKLPEELEQKLTEFFKKMDTDNSGSVDKEEAAAFWGKNFAKVRPTHPAAWLPPHVQVALTRTHAAPAPPRKLLQHFSLTAPMLFSSSL